MKTVFLSFASQKGGVGKSSMTSLMASYLHYLTKLNVFVIDADYPQYSIHGMRQRDSDLINGDNHFKQLAFNQLKVLGKSAYPIIKSTPDNAIYSAKQFLSSSKINYNMALFDLPGTVGGEGIIKTLSQLDYIIIPISSDRVVLESSLSFAKVLNKVFVSNDAARLKNVLLFWNQVDGRERNNLYKTYDIIIRELGLNLLNNRILDTKRFRKEILVDKKMIFCSTLFPASKRFTRESGIEDLFLEILKIILS